MVSWVGVVASVLGLLWFVALVYLGLTAPGPSATPVSFGVWAVECVMWCVFTYAALGGRSSS